MGSLKDGVDWGVNVVQRTAEGVGQGWDAMSTNTTDFRSTFVPIFFAGLAGIVAIGLIGNWRNIAEIGKGIGKDVISHPFNTAAGLAMGTAKIGLTVGTVMFAMGTIAEYSKTGNMAESAVTTMKDFGSLISNAVEAAGIPVPTFDPKEPNPRAEKVPVTTSTPSLGH